MPKTAPNGAVWILGGESTTGEVSTIIEYSHDTGAFKTLDLSLPSPVMGHAAASYDEGILVVGGRNRNQLRDAIDYVPFDGTATQRCPCC